MGICIGWGYILDGDKLLLLNKPFITINYINFRLFINSAIQYRKFLLCRSISTCAVSDTSRSANNCRTCQIRWLPVHGLGGQPVLMGNSQQGIANREYIYIYIKKYAKFQTISGFFSRFFVDLSNLG